MANEDNRYAITGSWGAPQTRDFQVPSGQTVQLRKLDVEDFAQMGILGHMDRLSSLVNENHIEPSKKRRPGDKPAKQLTKKQQAEKEAQENAESFKRMAENPDNLNMIVFMMDRVCVAGILQPALTHTYVGDVDKFTKIDYSDRILGRTYTDTIPFVDRMAIFQELMGDLEGLKSFRDGQDEGVGDVADEPGDGVSSERSTVSDE